MSKKGRKILALCLVVSMILTQLIFTNVASAAEGNRLYGSDRYQTAIKISQEFDASNVAVLAYGEDFPDALAAAPLAEKNNAPILLTAKDQLTTGVLAELQRLGVKKVFIVGGEGVVSAAVANAVTAAGITVQRLAGANRYETALKVAEEVGATDTVVVAYGENYPDALSISPIAAAKGWPILLTDTKAMDAAVKAYIGTKKVYVIGGTGVVSDAAVAGLSAERVFGADRYATNVAVLTKFDTDLDYANVYLATGENYPDALAGSALAAALKAPVVLVGGSTVGTTYAAKKVTATSSVVAFGGTSVVSNAALSAVVPVIPADLKVVSVSAVSAKEVKVVFNKPVDEATAEDTDHYTFTELGGSELSIDKAVLQKDGVSVILTLDDSLTNDDVDYTVVITDGILDVDGNELKEYKEIVALSDKVRPSVESVKLLNRDTLEITFSEAITGADDTSVQVLDGLDEQTVTVTATDDDVVQVTGLAGLDDGSYTLIVNSGIEDEAGNIITPNPYEKEFTLAEDNTEPTVKSISAISETAFRVVFSEPVENDGFEIAVAGTTLVKDTDYTIEEVDDSNMTEFVVTLNDSHSGLTKVRIDSFSDYSGNDNEDPYVKYLDFDDNGPKLESTKATIRTIGGDKYAVFTYDQDIDDLNAANVTGSYVDDDNSVIDVTIGGSALYTADTLSVLEDNELAIALDGLESGNYTVTLPANVVGAYGATSAKVDVTFSVSDAASSKIEVDSAVVVGTTLTVTFTGEVNNTALNFSNYTVEGDKIFTKAVFTNTNKDTVKLTIGAGTLKYAGDYLLAIKGVQDADGNAVKEYSEDIHFGENVKPYLYKAVVTDLTKVEATFNEALVNTSSITDADFVVTVNGAEVDITGVTTTDGKVYTLTIDKIDDLDAVVKVSTSKDFDGKDVAGNLGVKETVKTATWDIE